MMDKLDVFLHRRCTSIQCSSYALNKFSAAIFQCILTTICAIDLNKIYTFQSNSIWICSHPMLTNPKAKFCTLNTISRPKSIGASQLKHIHSSIVHLCQSGFEKWNFSPIYFLNNFVFSFNTKKTIFFFRLTARSYCRLYTVYDYV